ncbi:MAG: ankyrin repeat domain-containing protein, partial [Verrucomicrobiales bacterium]
TGFSGAFARQVTLSASTADDHLTGDMLDALETSASEGGIVLQVEGAFLEGQAEAKPVTLQFDGETYFDIQSEKRTITRDVLVSLARNDRFVGTFTGRHGANADYDFPQPALWTLSELHAQSGRQEFPIIYGEQPSMVISGRHVLEGASVFVDGRKVDGTVQAGEGDRLVIGLEKLPSTGMHFLQVQNPHGLFSNDFIFHVAANEEHADELRHEQNPDALRDALTRAISQGDLKETENLIKSGVSVNQRAAGDGSTPLNTAAFRGRSEIASLLLESGARVDHTSWDGNTPLHVAAFMCRTDIVELLLENGASPKTRNGRRESAIDVVSGAWSPELGGFYSAITSGSGFSVDLNEIERLRPEIKRLLEEHVRTHQG